MRAYPVLLVLLFVVRFCCAGEAGYDPLAVDAAAKIATLDLSVSDKARSREIPLRLYLPASTAPAPVLLFSHGLGGSREGSAFLGRHWAARGYLAVFLQHPGSDAAVWKDASVGQKYATLRQAADFKNLLLRVKDVPAVLDQLALWNNADGNALRGRFDLARVGMSGHSFGAVTTQAVSGQSFARAGSTFTDPRIKAALILSPSAPRGSDAAQAFAKVKIPWMLMTGTKDVAKIVDIGLDARLAVFTALPAGSNYELVLDGAEHSVFTDRSLPGESGGRNPNHHRVILALSTAFWDAYLRADPAAKTWLDGNGPAAVLEKADTFRKK